MSASNPIGGAAGVATGFATGPPTQVAAPVWLSCSGCGNRVELGAAEPFVCPRASPGDDIDHVLVRRIDPEALSVPAAVGGNPYVQCRDLMSYGSRARALGVEDARLVELIEQLDEAIERVDGHGFVPTPLRAEPTLAAACARPLDSLWAKDETGNVAGSHKARHLMGVMIHLRLAEVAGIRDPAGRPPLAIASCGNAALAAGVVAAAAGWPLEVFVPPQASPSTVERLRSLGATVTPCPRDGRPGDPCMRAFEAARARGALPFSVQGSVNGLAVEGGLTLGYELAAQVRAGPGRLDALVVQVGGGALGSACWHALRDAVAWGVLPSLPRLHTVQTAGAWPLRRAYERVVEVIAARVGGTVPQLPLARADWLRRCPASIVDAALLHAANHRSSFMQPWEIEPQSVACGILDDETYDWWALVEGMIRTGGIPIVADEDALVAAHEAVGRYTGVRASATGTAGVGGIWAMAEDAVFAEQAVAVLLTGVER
ncbi:MAG: pyridoxal-phosphate dependent enzyme [Myxococcota bacterium]